MRRFRMLGRGLCTLSLVQTRYLLVASAAVALLILAAGAIWFFMGMT
jgi:hypothetical protein